jgi:hypothetical protein
MISSVDSSDLQATLLDFGRRIALLEEMVHGHEQKALPTEFLLGVYVDAQREQELSTELCRHWVRQAFLLDSRQLLVLSRLSQDLHPWRPLLALLDRYAEAGYEVELARVHVLSIAQDLLTVQGLDLIRPRDVMGHDLPMKAAVIAISL